LWRFRGLSPCRFCGRHNGSAEFTDDSYYWPEGLVHHITEHDVRLPEEFVVPALASLGACKDPAFPVFDDLGERVTSRHLEIVTFDRSDKRTVFLDQRWWRKQQQLSEPPGWAGHSRC
jgi:hypothetical protein